MNTFYWVLWPTQTLDTFASMLLCFIQCICMKKVCCSESSALGLPTQLKLFTLGLEILESQNR